MSVITKRNNQILQHRKLRRLSSKRLLGVDPFSPTLVHLGIDGTFEHNDNPDILKQVNGIQDIPGSATPE